MEGKKQKLPTVAARQLTFLPGMNTHFDVSRPKSIKAVERAMLKNQKALVVTQKNSEVQEPGMQDLYSVGTVIRIRQLIKLPNKIVRVLAEGVERVSLQGLEEELGCLMGETGDLPEIVPERDEVVAKAMMRQLQGQFRKYMELGPRVTKETAAEILNEQQDLSQMMGNLVIALPVDYRVKQKFLECDTLQEQFFLLADLMRDELEIQKIEAELSKEVKDRIDKNQREYVLREHLKLIREELGDAARPDDVSEYEEKLNKLTAGPEIKEKIQKEINHLKMVSASPSENAVMRTYIETLLEMPWDLKSTDNNDIKHAAQILDEDHYGLNKVKERVLEFLAVRTLTGGGDSPIICLVGPPGTGKTSIARSVARALDKKYVRICLGGVRDEAEIRGHRKTYVGAMPGRIAAALKQAGVKNPLMLLDEVDKLGNDYKGDPSSALLEVLDGEQNSHFNDHYIEAPVDLSEVLFIATANDLQTIPRPLLDRMEIIEVSSYTANEKLHIAREHLVEKQLKKNGLKKNQLSISDKAIAEMIASYTRESGVRELERKIGAVCRKAAKELLEEDKKSVKVSKRNLEQYLGRPLYRTDTANLKNEIGVARGLAWTQVGGDTLQIEVGVMPGSGECTLTGQMGDVMKESAQTAISYIRSICADYAIPEDFFKNHDLHIHIPEGAVPKDGPSAGITMATAILSAVAEIPVCADLAMTGEVTLRGRVLPIGGLKEKLLAAKTAGIHKVLVPKENQPDIEELDEEITGGMQIIFVAKMPEVLRQALA